MTAEAVEYNPEYSIQPRQLFQSFPERGIVSQLTIAVGPLPSQPQPLSYIFEHIHMYKLLL